MQQHFRLSATTEQNIKDVHRETGRNEILKIHHCVDTCPLTPANSASL